MRYLFVLICLLMGYVIRMCNSDFFSSVSDKGEFTLNLKHFGNCNDSMCGTKEIQLEGRLRRKSRTETILVGNFTVSVPFDDNILMEIHFYKHHSERGYQKFPFTLKFAKACADSKFFLGKEFSRMFRNAVNRCPLPPGTYIMSGIDIEDIVKHQGTVLPPQFFYGRYKIIVFFKHKKDTKGCFMVLFECKPNWH